MSVYIGIDDTDRLDSIGTGRLAREIAEILGKTYPVVSVTRHQFFVHPDIPYTSHNSCAVIHLKDIPYSEYALLFEKVKSLMKERFIDGSDPGIALAGSNQVNPAVVAFGLDAKRSVVTQERARTIALHAEIFLEGLGGTEGGVIGAVGGVGLAASGSDGRYLQIGSIRDRRGDHTAEELLNIGIDQVITTDGKVITEGLISIPKFPQPVRLLERPVLLVDEQDGHLVSVKRD
jgi:tRNA(Ile2) C34 agmatinyltransferase TiaS